MAPTLARDRARVRVLAQAVMRFRRRSAWAHIGNLLRRLHPADVAQLLEELPRPIRGELLGLAGDPEQQADILAELEAEEASRILQQIEPEAATVRIVEAMSADDAAAVFRVMPDGVREHILGLMKQEDSEDVEDILHWESDTAGAMMTPDVFTLPEDRAVEDAIRSLRVAREAKEAETVFYLYACNDLGQLVGVVSLRALVVSDPRARLSDVMERDVITVKPDADREEVARLVEHYNFIALPVVDDQRHLLGIITVDDVIDVLREEATEDLLRMSGARDVPVRGTPILTRLPGRLVWLLVSTLVALAIAWAIHFEVAAAAPSSFWFALIPVLVVLSITTAMQSAAVAVGAVTGEALPAEGVLPYLAREMGTGVLVAALAGSLAAGGLGWILPDWSATFPLGASIAVGVAVASLFGSAVPLLLHRFHTDPTQATGVVVLVLATVLSTILGLAMANAIL